MGGRDQLAASPVFTPLPTLVKWKLQRFPNFQSYYGDNALTTLRC